MRLLTGPRLLLATISLVVLLLVVGIRFVNQWAEWGSLTSGDLDLSTPSSLVPLLTAPVPNSVGDVVFLNDVQLKKGPQAGVFFVEGSQGRQMLVVSDDGTIATGFGKVDIKGQIRKMPAVQILRKEWHLTSRQADVFEKQALYITAEHIRAQPESAASDEALATLPSLH